ncbi:hypothetical protein [Cryobacterium lyxosi]|uniref:Uncharacterized protein n=1 Tax=Cryobacterium lyxosi TaxID=1259228 RepID=A0A4R8ZJN5_9MICO|nr:hypothetical protein [Cryobacterium lyxosi]TFD27341.1 hypothetical protein E3T27_06185 [Cryobacterium lyxosi]
MPDKGPTPKNLAQRFFDLCLLLLGGIIALWVALQFLAQFWGWIALIAVLVTAIWALVQVLRARRNRW